MAVQSAGEVEKNSLGGCHVLISSLPLLPPLEYLSSKVGTSLGVHPHRLQLCYQAKLMSSPKVTQSGLPTAILNHSF